MPPGPPPQRKLSPWLTVGLPVVAGLLLLGGCGTASVFFLRTVGGETGPARGAAESYAQALVEGGGTMRTPASAARCRPTSPPTSRPRTTPPPGVTSYAVAGVDVQSFNGRTSADVTVTLVYADGLRAHVVLPLTDEDGSWRPCP